MLQKPKALLVVVSTTFAIVLGGILSAADAQSTITCCVTNKGKLKNCGFENNPRKECKKDQTLVTIPILATTDQLSLEVSLLEATDEELMAADKKAKAAAALLSQRVEELEEQVDLVGECLSTDRYVDLGLTVYDCRTQLEWEKKLPADGSGGGNCDASNEEDRDVRCVNRFFTWSTQCVGCGYPPDGTAFTEFLATLNADEFAGHDDWRIPEAHPGAQQAGPRGNGGVKLDGSSADTAELETILLEPFPCGPTPCIDPIFGATNPGEHWTSIEFVGRGAPAVAWTVGFASGVFIDISKPNRRSVRAVRSRP